MYIMSLFSLAKQTKHILGQSSRMFSMSRSYFDTKTNVHMKDSVMYNYSIYLNLGHLMPGVENKQIAEVTVKIVDDDVIKTDNKVIQSISNNGSDVMFKNIKEAPVTHYTYN
jgi:hypothetical protein